VVADFVTIEKGLGPEGRIAVVRFDRGDGINALSPEAMRQLTQAARSFEDDGNTSVVVLTGGPRAFSAGFDLKDPEGRSRKSMDLGSLRRHLKLGPRLSRAWQDMEQITIGAIEGFCIGGGVALAVALDFRVMARDAHLRVPEIGLGMNMSWQSIPRMLHLMGPARTKQAVILADQRISAAEAYEVGPGGGGRRSGHGFRRCDDAGHKGGSAAAVVGRHDQADRQSSRARARRSRQPHGRRPVRAGEPDRGS
jgi:enoyl-CoA hydratase